jgi:hypothetical protein
LYVNSANNPVFRFSNEVGNPFFQAENFNSSSAEFGIYHHPSFASPNVGGIPAMKILPNTGAVEMYNNAGTKTISFDLQNGVVNSSSANIQTINGKYVPNTSYAFYYINSTSISGSGVGYKIGSDISMGTYITGANITVSNTGTLTSITGSLWKIDATIIFDTLNANNLDVTIGSLNNLVDINVPTYAKNANISGRRTCHVPYNIMLAGSLTNFYIYVLCLTNDSTTVSGNINIYNLG